MGEDAFDVVLGLAEGDIFDEFFHGVVGMTFAPFVEVAGSGVVGGERVDHIAVGAVEHALEVYGARAQGVLG